MPSYEFRCDNCWQVFVDKDIHGLQLPQDHTMDDGEWCPGELKRLYTFGGVVLKGGGFYRTDSRDVK